MFHYFYCHGDSPLRTPNLNSLEFFKAVSIQASHKHCICHGSCMVKSAAELLGSLTANIFNSFIYDYKHTVKSTRNGNFRFRKKSNHRLSTLILVVNYNLRSCSFTKKRSPQEKKTFGKT